MNYIQWEIEMVCMLIKSGYTKEQTRKMNISDLEKACTEKGLFGTETEVRHELTRIRNEYYRNRRKEKFPDRQSGKNIKDTEQKRVCPV